MDNNTGRIIKELCENKGITIAEMERNLNLANASVSRWIKGSNINSTALIKIADYFHVSTDYLLGRTHKK